MAHLALQCGFHLICTEPDETYFHHLKNVLSSKVQKAYREHQQAQKEHEELENITSQTAQLLESQKEQEALSLIQAKGFVVDVSDQKYGKKRGVKPL